MMKSIVTVAFVATAALSIVGCKSKTEGKSETKTAAKGTEGESAAAKPAAPAKAAAKVWKKVASMNIEVEVAADADVQDNTASSGFPSSTIYSLDGTPTTFIFGATNLDESLALSKDFESTKARLQKETNGFGKFTKEENKGEGFVLEFDGKNMIDNKPTYGVAIRSKVGNLVVECSTNADSETGRAAATALCNSIRAAK